MRPSDIPRTTSFRLALLFLALFGAASLVLFGFLYWQTVVYLGSRTDEWLDRETAGFSTVAISSLAARLDSRAGTAVSAQRPFALFDASGAHLAGNAIPLPTPNGGPLPGPPLDQPFDFALTVGGEMVWFRGMVHRMPSGELLLISQDVDEMNEFHEVLVGAMASGGVLVLIVGLAGAVVTGTGALRHIDAVTRAIERIVNGNLAERLPRQGSGGDLDRLVQVVNGMLDDIERLMHEVKGVCDNIAHDLRTPLTRLLAGLERASRRATSTEAYAAAVDEAVVEIKGVLDTFNALMRISEAEDGARRAGFTTLDLASVAADVVEFYDPLAEAKEIALVFETDGPASLAGDPSLLFEAIGNLVDNAVKFTPSGGRITVRAFHGTKGPGVSVTDTGPGIPMEEREAVQRRFYRAEKSRHTPGTGLGLSLVAAVSRLHGLALSIDDARPGCRVTLSQTGGTGLSS
ncbi:sensor histidine kinase [Azospirillum sp. TSA2s]|uniref:sensor histidine kinase n=1 Tax=Azospirillum sp. TSA2s TaxID=709810 RepID=UPI0026828076